MVEGKVSKGKSQFITKKYLLLLALIITACSNTIPTSTQVVVATVVSSTFDASKTPILISTPTETSITLTGTVIPATETPLPLTNTPTPRPTDALTPTATAYEQESQYGNAWEAAMANPENREILGSEQGIENLTITVYGGNLTVSGRELVPTIQMNDLQRAREVIAGLIDYRQPIIFSIDINPDSENFGHAVEFDTSQITSYEIAIAVAGSEPDGLIPLYKSGTTRDGEGKSVDGILNFGLYHNPEAPDTLKILIVLPKGPTFYRDEWVLPNTITAAIGLPALPYDFQSNIARARNTNFGGTLGNASYLTVNPSDEVQDLRMLFFWGTDREYQPTDTPAFTFKY